MGRCWSENHVLKVYEEPLFPTCTIWVFPEVSSLVAQTVKDPPAMQETSAGSLSWEDPLEEGMAAHSGILAWRIPWIEEPGGLQSVGSQRVRHN